MALTKITSSGITDSAVNTSKILDGTIIDADIAAGAGISPSKFGLSTPPTLTSFTPTTIDDDVGGNITITGTGFVSIPQVTLINTSTGAIVTASTVTFTSSTSLTAGLPSGGGSGIYKVRVENPDGLAVQSSSTLTYSSDPTWSTSSGSLGSVAKGGTASFSVSASSDSTIAYSVVSGALPTGLSLNSSTGAITGTESGSDTSETAYSFTIRATDAESQTADRAFSITVTVGITEGGQFN